MDFSNKGYFMIPFGDSGVGFIFNDTIISILAISAIMIGLALLIRHKAKNFENVPKNGFQNTVEMIIETLDNMIKTTVPARFEYLGNWFFGLFFFILFSNLSGLIGLRAPTADLTVTAGFGITSFLLIQIFAFKAKKAKYFKGFLEPVPFFLPINLIGEFATPISLSFRLFGNVLGGTIIMGLIYELFPWFLKIGIPSFLHIYFDLFAGALQAYIFLVLSMTFLKNATEE